MADETYDIGDDGNGTVTKTTIKIYNEMDTDDAASLIAFFVFIFVMVILGLCIYYGSGIRLWIRKTLIFPLSRLCCQGERHRLWELHKEAVIAADSQEMRGAEELLNGDDPLEAELSTLVGLEPLKNEIRALRRTLVVEEQRRRVLGKKEKAKTHAPHMIFRGSPGTGKTHAARLIARLLKQLGYVHGDIVEVQRADLVAGYVGQTQHKTRAVINRAKGAVLFVDEAYALAPKFGQGGRDFGSEAIQELMRDLTSGDPVVILAGYADEMERFLRVNPGLSRRFQVRFTFKDYSAAELAAIFLKIVARHGYKPACTLSDVETLFSRHFHPDLCRKWNGGLPEGLFRRAQDALARRLNVMSMSPDSALTITYDDILTGSHILRATLGDASPRVVQPMGRRHLDDESDDDDDDDDPDENSEEYDGLLLPGGGASAAPPGGGDGRIRRSHHHTTTRNPVHNGSSSTINQTSPTSIEDLLTNPSALLPAFSALHTLAPRVAALEAAVARLGQGESQNSQEPPNPWEHV